MGGPDVHSSNTIIDNGTFGTCTIRSKTSLLTRQANGSALIYLDDDTTVFAAITASKAPKGHFDPFPLAVDVEERSYTARCIPGSFFRREGRPGTEAILIARFTDRPLRPTFKRGVRNKVQMVATVMTINPDGAYGVLAINAVSMATSLARLPFSGPIGGTHMALIDGQWVAFPRWSELRRATFSVTIAGRVANDDIAIMAVETQTPEHVDAVIKAGGAKPTEAEVTAGMEAAKPVIRTLCEVQSRLAKECGKPVGDFPLFPDYTGEQYGAVEEEIDSRFTPVLGIVAEVERDEALNELTESAIKEFTEAFPEEEAAITATVNAAFKKTMRHHVFTEGVRVDGRTPVEIRTITAETGVLPRVHSSALLQRGETQILGAAALNMLKMGQQLDNLPPATSRRYIHHYSFPPYPTGETGHVGSPKRREIGHEHLAEIALESQLPGREEFPYAIRQISETMDSNGSSSMGSVCASTLSFYNTGVPLKTPVAGVAMGLVSATIDGEIKYCTLTDILGTEDALGDIDFRVAETREHVTALQLDTKLDDISAMVLDAVLGQTRDARFAILDLIIGAINGSGGTAATAPHTVTVKIPVDKIGEIIGSKGKMINRIQEDTDAGTSIEDDGTIFIGVANGSSAEAARQAVSAIANPQIPEVGERFVNTVVKATTFGVFVSLAPGRDDLLHISQIRRIIGDKHVESVKDVLSVGDKVKIEIAETDPRGKVSLRAVVEEEPKAPAEQEEVERPARRKRGSRRAPCQRRRSSESSGSTE